MSLGCIVLDHSDWDSNLAKKTDLERTCQIEVKLVTNCDEWFLTIGDNLENMSG